MSAHRTGCWSSGWGTTRTARSPPRTVPACRNSTGYPGSCIRSTSCSTRWGSTRIRIRCGSRGREPSTRRREYMRRGRVCVCVCVCVCVRGLRWNDTALGFGVVHRRLEHQAHPSRPVLVASSTAIFSSRPPTFSDVPHHVCHSQDSQPSCASLPASPLPCLTPLHPHPLFPPSPARTAV